MSALTKYYRQPGLHISLPTGGAFLPEGSIEFTASGEVPVLPMRGADEMLLMNPDALMSGHALEKLLESCVPSIKTPWLVSTCDLDVILLAIRAASAGNTMPLTAKCPECSTESDFDCDLPQLLGTMQKVDPENPVRLSDDVIAYVRPYTLRSATSVSMIAFEEQRRLQAIEAQNPGAAERTTEMNRTMDRITEVSNKAIAESIIKIVVPDATVTDHAEIADFFNNISKKWSDLLLAKISEINNKGIDKSIQVKCMNVKCGHEWKTVVEFDPASFFAGGSSQ